MGRILPHMAHERLKLVRIEGRRRYYKDSKHPDLDEFYVLDSEKPLMHEDIEFDQPSQRIRDVHPKHPNLGPYYVRHDGTEVFVNKGRPFHLGALGGIHKIFVPPPHNLVRSRANGQAGRSGGISADS